MPRPKPADNATRSDDPGAPAGREEAGSSRQGPILSELLRRAIETGVKNLPADAVKQVLAELNPKVALHQKISLLDETKNGLYRAIGKEVHDLVQNARFSEELVKALRHIALEINMEIRFKPSHTSQTAPAEPAAAEQSSDPSDVKEEGE